MTEDCTEGKLREVPASETLGEILQDTVVYDHVIVKGDLDLSKLDLPPQHIERTSFEKEQLKLSEEAKLVKSKVKIAKSKIDGFLVILYFQMRLFLVKLCSVERQTSVNLSSVERQTSMNLSSVEMQTSMNLSSVEMQTSLMLSSVVCRLLVRSIRWTYNLL